MSNDSNEPDQFISAIEYPQPFDDYVVKLCRSASRYIYILSATLDHTVFDRRELVEAISDLVRGSGQTEVRIVVSDTRALVSRGHQLLNLARRLPSKVLIQKLTEHPDWKGQTLVIRDLNGVLFKPGGSEHDAFYEPDSRASTQQHLDLFKELWRHSVKDPELRSLSL